MEKERGLAATYSFLLPGLGQVYQRRNRVGALFFIGFVLTLGFSLHGLASVATALFSSGEILFWKRYAGGGVPEETKTPWYQEWANDFRGRNLLYSLGGIIGFLAWFPLAASTFFTQGFEMLSGVK